MKLLVLSFILKSKDNFKSFKVNVVCKLTKKFYLEHFNEYEMYYLRSHLKHYHIDVIHHKSSQNMSTISELCQGLVETNKSQHYHLIDKLIHLVMTLHVFIATIKQSFLAMKHVKAMLCNKMEHDLILSRFYNDLH